MYEGRHSENFAVDQAYLLKDLVNGYLVSAMRISPREHRIFIEPEASRTLKIDILFKSNSDDTSLVKDFLGNLRGCSRANLSIECEQEPLLKNVEL
ncbi:MAG: hypothetical protein WEA82_05475 [Idiomarina sp.]